MAGAVDNVCPLQQQTIETSVLPEHAFDAPGHFAGVHLLHHLLHLAELIE